MARYVRNPGGQIHSVDDEHYAKYLSVNVGNRFVLLPGWEEVDEATARAEHPQEFGAHDPNVVYTATERAEFKKRAEFEAEFSGDPADGEPEPSGKK